jgi:hypothetical protein
MEVAGVCVYIADANRFTLNEFYSLEVNAMPAAMLFPARARLER